MPVPTWRLALVAALAALAYAAAPADPATTFVLVNAALLLAALVDWALAPSPRRLEVAREVAGTIGLGADAPLRWRVTNPTGRRLRVRVADALPPSLLGGPGPKASAARRGRLTVPRRGRAFAQTTLRPRRRGRFELRDVTVRVEGPLGLVARQARIAVPATLRVYPPFRSRKEAELRLDRARQLESGLRTAKGRGGGTEFDALREYTIDDEFRRIDWAATARARKPIVRTYRAERNQTVLVLLDSGRTMAGRIAIDDDARGVAELTIPRLDHAMDAVMMLVAVTTGLGDRAGLVAFADEVRGIVPPSARRTQLTRVTEAMYALQPRLAESDYRRAFGETLSRFRRRALLVVLSELSEQAVNETLLPALPLVVRDHLVVVAGMRDPDVDRWAYAEPTEASNAYRKAAAIAALSERRRTANALRARGAVVVDAVPAQLPGLLADAYLRVKASGSL